jgi:hypothetical protein
MNVETGTETARFPEQEYINGHFHCSAGGAGNEVCKSHYSCTSGEPLQLYPNPNGDYLYRGTDSDEGWVGNLKHSGSQLVYECVINVSIVVRLVLRRCRNTNPDRKDAMSRVSRYNPTIKKRA